jgi:hypothetical protein
MNANANINYMEETNQVYGIIQALYYYTHIVPTEQDFNDQINNYDLVYLILYWLNKEHLYPLFEEEEMDLLSIACMQEEDLRYFHMENDITFRELVMVLNQ